MLTWAVIATVLALAAVAGVAWLVIKHYRVIGSLRDISQSVTEIGSKVHDSRKSDSDSRTDPSGGG